MAKRSKAKRKSAPPARAASRRTAKRPAAKPPAAKRRAAKQPPAKRPAAKPPAAKRRAAKLPPAKRPAVKRPAAGDFDVVVQVGKGLVSVLFRPTNGHYLFRIVANANAKPRSSAKPGADVELQSGTPGSSDRYAEADVADMAMALASAAVADVLV